MILASTIFFFKYFYVKAKKNLNIEKDATDNVDFYESYWTNKNSYFIDIKSYTNFISDFNKVISNNGKVWKILEKKTNIIIPGDKLNEIERKNIPLVVVFFLLKEEGCKNCIDSIVNSLEQKEKKYKFIDNEALKWCVILLDYLTGNDYSKRRVVNYDDLVYLINEAKVNNPLIAKECYDFQKLVKISSFYLNNPTVQSN